MTTLARFRDRQDAGRQLADRLATRRLDRPVVLGLPRGGVPVAAEIARRLHAPLDVALVRKLGVPGQEELAFGAIAPGGVRALNPDVLAHLGIRDAVVARVEAEQRKELERREARWLRGRAAVDVRDRTVLVVDDGIATGASLVAALEALALLGAKRRIAAAPVGSVEGCQLVARHADELICPLQPPRFLSVGSWYDDFTQTTDEEVDAILGEAALG